MKKLLLIPLLLILLSGYVILLSALFISGLILYKLGRLPAIDLDPIAFVAGLLLVVYSQNITLLYLFIGVPMLDLVSSRFNHWSFINIISAAIPVLVLSLFTLNSITVILLVILCFNLMRFVLAKSFNGGYPAFISAISNTSIYTVILAVTGPLISLVGKLYI